MAKSGKNISRNYDDMKHLEYGLVRAIYDTRDETNITVEEILDEQ